MLKKTDPEPPVRLPIAAGAITNGEGWWPDTARKKLIRKLVLEKAEEVSRKEGVDRREFLASSCGMATTLYMINLVNGCSSGHEKNDARLGMGGSSGGGSGSGPSGGNSSAGNSGGGSGTTGSTGNAGAGSMAGGGSGSGSGGSGGGAGGFVVPPDAMHDGGMADLCMGNGGNELIIDMQSHFANTETNPFGATLLNSFISQITPERYPWIKRTDGCTGAACYDRMEYVNQIFMGSDTTIGVLSGISYAVGDGGVGGIAVLTNEDLLDGAMKLEAAYPGRMLTHCMVMPNDRKQVQFDMMDRLAGMYSNWKTYPPWAPGGGTGYFLDQDVGPEMIDRGIKLASPIFCIHKGFPLNGFSAPHCDPKDVTGASAMFPEARLVIYHSAFENGLAAGQTSAAGVGATDDVGWGPGVGQWPEGEYNEALEADMAMATSTANGGYPLNRGVNSLVWALRKAGIGRNGVYNDGSKAPAYIYAECGGVWPALMMGRVEEAQHYWGKLLKYVGEDRMVWGTDCLWFGSPQPLIEAFRAFTISDEFMTKYGYPQLTPAIKEKVLGQNAALIQNARQGVNISGCHSDFVGMAAVRERREYDLEFGRRRDMMANVWAPQTRREFFKLVAEENAEKARFSGNFPDRPQGRPETRLRRG
jgi:predicted TIM-barrel fold metal-dependent hydrolase